MNLIKVKVKMKFCPQCRNMLYSIDEDTIGEKTGAVRACRKCEYKEAVPESNPVVYEHILRGTSATTLAMNPYLKYDPTLEHLSNIVCPNKQCPTKANRSLVPDVVPVEIDNKNLVWMYQCGHCDNTWTQSSRIQ